MDRYLHFQKLENGTGAIKKKKHKMFRSINISLDIKNRVKIFVGLSVYLPVRVVRANFFGGLLQTIFLVSVHLFLLGYTVAVWHLHCNHSQSAYCLNFVFD